MYPTKTMLAGFAPPTRRQWALADASGCGRIIFGLDDEDDDSRGADRTDYADVWKPRPQWRAGRLESSIAEGHRRGYAVGVHYWGRPVVSWMDEAHRYCRQVHAACGLEFVMGDFERHAVKMDAVTGGYPDGWKGVARHIVKDWGVAEYEDAFPGWPLYGLALYGLPTEWGLELVGELLRAGVLIEVLLMIYNADPALYARCIKAWVAKGIPVDVLTVGFGTYGDHNTRAGMLAAVQAAKNEGATRGAWWSLRTTNTAEAQTIKDAPL